MKRLITSSGLILVIFICALAQQQSNAPRRPLPKPPQGARGFEQYAGRDASSRLIAAGATRAVGNFANRHSDARKPVAPLEGIALEARPFFLWEPAAAANTYKFLLYEGDVYANPKARLVYETEVKQPQLIYPADAPSLQPGTLYSWRIGAPSSTVRDGSSGSKLVGMSANFFVLIDEDAQAVRRALAEAGVTTPTDAKTWMKHAQILADYGVWYDALRIARTLVAEQPKDTEVQTFYDSLLAKLDG